MSTESSLLVNVHRNNNTKTENLRVDVIKRRNHSRKQNTGKWMVMRYMLDVVPPLLLEGTTNNYRPPSATLLTHLADVLRGENSRLLDVADTLFLPVVLPGLRPEPGAVRGLNMPVMSV